MGRPKMLQSDVIGFLIVGQALLEGLYVLILNSCVVVGCGNNLDYLSPLLDIHYAWQSVHIHVVQVVNRSLDVSQGNVMLSHFRVDRAHIDKRTCNLLLFELSASHFLLYLQHLLQVLDCHIGLPSSKSLVKSNYDLK